MFLIRAADPAEVISQVKRHAATEHGKTPPSDERVRDRMDTVEVE
ncbi:hypothetical protein HTSR_1113 [Halodesulfurarchaeum formicicum]|uniref:DUF1059 domain-containing protein n=1 Tax=Halodesulfurarchaeum formicicum TaxID=1873524 RepID=A0A1D8S4L2_9EURY|nr:hypothetical protein HTSR_1113 [Halodesulfurarchaeum formicicum]APE95596.1 hypothetical protein HSR6_1148 [Halodesulfurarchaeum formicicum]